MGLIKDIFSLFEAGVTIAQIKGKELQIKNLLKELENIDTYSQAKLNSLMNILITKDIYSKEGELLEKFLENIEEKERVFYKRLDNTSMNEWNRRELLGDGLGIEKKFNSLYEKYEYYNKIIREEDLGFDNAKYRYWNGGNGIKKNTEDLNYSIKSRFGIGGRNSEESDSSNVTREFDFMYKNKAMLDYIWLKEQVRMMDRIRNILK